MATVGYIMVTDYWKFDKNNYFCRCCDGLPEYLQTHQKVGGSSFDYNNLITAMPLLCMVIKMRRHLSCSIQIYEVGKTQAQLLYWVAKMNEHFPFYLEWLRKTVFEHPSSPLSTSIQIYY
jgi:hypothetical protein